MSVKKIWAVIRGNLSVCFRTPRFYIAVILVAILFQQMTGPIRTFCAQTGYAVTPWLFPHFMGEHYIQNIFSLGIVLIFCDAPFIKNNTPYVILRTGRRKWLWSQIGYIVVNSFLYCAALYMVSLILVLPYLTIDGGWGKVIGTLAQTNAFYQVGTIRMDYQLIVGFEPWQATFLSVAMGVAVCTFIGLLMMCINLFGHIYLGPVAGAAVAFTPYLADIFSDMYAGYYVAPPAWMEITMLGKNSLSPYPTVPYAVLFLTGWIFLFICCAHWKFRRQVIEVISTEG